MEELIGIGFAVLLAYFFFKGGKVAGSVSVSPIVTQTEPTTGIRNITQTPAGWQVSGGTDALCPAWGCGPNPVEVGGIFSATPGAPASAPTGGAGGTSGTTGTYAGGGGGGSFSGGHRLTTL